MKLLTHPACPVPVKREKCSMSVDMNIEHELEGNYRNSFPSVARTEGIKESIFTSMRPLSLQYPASKMFIHFDLLENVMPRAVLNHIRPRYINSH